MTDTDQSISPEWFSQRDGEHVYANPWYQKPENRVIHAQRANAWYHRNREVVLDKRRQKHDCELCGGRYTTDHKQEHFRSKKHVKAVEKTQVAIRSLFKLLGHPEPKIFTAVD